MPAAVPFTFVDNVGGTLVGESLNLATDPTTDTAEGCDNCAAQQADHTLATGRVVLTNALITRWKQQVPHQPEAAGAAPQVLASMSPADVVAFLQDNLHWRVTSEGAPVDFAAVPSVKVSLVVGKADHFADPSKMSRFYGYRPAYQVTQGRPGGAGPEDHLYPAGSEWRNDGA